MDLEPEWQHLEEERSLREEGQRAVKGLPRNRFFNDRWVPIPLLKKRDYVKKRILSISRGREGDMRQGIW